MKPSVYMEEMDAFTYRDKLEGDSIFFIPVGALEQHGSHMAMCVDAALTKTMAGETAKALEEATNGKVHGIVTAPINYGFPFPAAQRRRIPPHRHHQPSRNHADLAGTRHRVQLDSPGRPVRSSS